MKISLNTNFKISSNPVNTGHGFSSPYFKRALPYDSVDFKGTSKAKWLNVDYDTASFVADSLYTSTAGHRAKYNTSLFNSDVVELLTLATFQHAKNCTKKDTPKILIGGDTRPASVEMLPQIKDTLLNQGADVIYIKDPIPSPLLAMAAEKEDIDIAILLTASHNPWDDAGFNLVTNQGAIAPIEVTSKVAKSVLDIADKGYYTKSDKKGELTELDPYETYKNYLDERSLIDWDKIKKSGISIYYDSLGGTGAYILPRLLKDNNIPFKVINSPKKEGPNPVLKNLKELTQKVIEDKNDLKIGLSNDGDADRFGVIDEKGSMISPHDALLLTAHHLFDNKKLKGAILRSQSTSSKLDDFAKNNGLELISTPVGFKYIGAEILAHKKDGNDVLVAGEESGGLTIIGHTLEKDGILANLLMLDLMASENKPLSVILDEQKAELSGYYSNVSINKTLKSDSEKRIALKKIEQKYSMIEQGDLSFGEFEIDPKATLAHEKMMKKYRPQGDGTKFYFTDGSSILIRKSGTEPKLRIYIEAKADSMESADKKAGSLELELNKILNY